MQIVQEGIALHVPIIPFWKVLWVVDVSTKIKAFIWLLLHGRLPVKDKLVTLNLLSAQLNSCPVCGDREEKIFHLFIH